MSRGVFVFVLIVLLGVPATLVAEERREFVFEGGLDLSFNLPSDRWKVSQHAPEQLVRETVEHVAFHMEEEGKDRPDDLEDKVRSRLSQNELYVYNPETGAHLDIDLSPITDPRNPPSDKTVALSAQYARAELAQEKDLSDVTSSSSQIDLAGAQSAHRIDASFLRDGEPRIFIGIVGFSRGYWTYFYYTDKKQDSRDIPEMEKLLGSLALEGGD